MSKLYIQHLMESRNSSALVFFGTQLREEIFVNDKTFA